jgi:hypothetical protein
MTHVPGAGRVIRMLALARSYNDLTLRDTSRGTFLALAAAPAVARNDG